MFTVIQFVTPVWSELMEIELIYIDEFNFIELKLNFVLYKHIYSIYISKSCPRSRDPIETSSAAHFGGVGVAIG